MIQNQVSHFIDIAYTRKVIQNCFTNIKVKWQKLELSTYFAPKGGKSRGTIQILSHMTKIAETL